ncbi:putative secreted/membrane protein [Bacillus phage AR9]|uniref:Putative secreted/membrane protein n=1 Tax=Bacillus phage AR9 TaxID=1815509 RepID=A0A172JIG7_BPPB1|nr:putative secreted/membrane protein [Bacillus phage AR9]AMS01342.1 putative secreted/membrane protein [Bacillus phage AR9]
MIKDLKTIALCLVGFIIIFFIIKTFMYSNEEEECLKRDHYVDDFKWEEYCKNK